MSFFGFMSAPVSIPRVFDTTPCLEHLMEYEDCVIDVQSDKKQLLMPAWPTLWPGLLDGKGKELLKTDNVDMRFSENMEKDRAADDVPLTPRQRQLLYECEEERMVYKACARKLLTLRRNAKMTTWEHAEISSMGLN